MAAKEVIELTHARIEIQVRTDYVFVIKSGALTSTMDVQRYCAAMDEVISRTGIDRAIIDARGEVGDPPSAVRAAMWLWLTSEDSGFETVAFVLPTEIAVARMNESALARDGRVQAFESVTSAQGWLRPGPSSMVRPRLPKAQPEQNTVESAETEWRSPKGSSLHNKLRPGQYKSLDAPIDHIPWKKGKCGGSEVA